MDEFKEYGLNKLNKLESLVTSFLKRGNKQLKNEGAEAINQAKGMTNTQESDLDTTTGTKSKGGRTRKGGLKFKAGINTDLDLDLGISLNKLLKRKTLRADTKKLLKKINKLTTNNKTKNVRKLKRRKSLNKKSRKRRN